MAKTFGKKVFNVEREDVALYDIFPFDKNTATFEFGDAVTLDSNGNIVKATAAAAGQVIGFVYNDSDEPNANIIGKAKVFLRNFVAITDKYNTTANYAPGTELTVKAGVVDAAVTGDVVIGQALGVPVDGVLRFMKY